MRGQLVDAPGYMMNYAAGAILIAAIRERTRAGATVSSPRRSRPGTAWVAPRLYRFGLERPTREVVEEFLGGPVSPARPAHRHAPDAPDRPVTLFRCPIRSDLTVVLDRTRRRLP